MAVKGSYTYGCVAVATTPGGVQASRAMNHGRAGGDSDSGGGCHDAGSRVGSDYEANTRAL